MSIPTPLKRQKNDETNPVQLAMAHLGSAYDVVLNHVPSQSFLSMSFKQLISYLVRMEGCEPGSLWWEPKEIDVKPYDTDYSDDPSLRKLFSMLPHEKITRILDNLYALDQNMYHLLKRLLTGASLALLDLGSERTTRLLTLLKGAPQGNACQESDDTIWIKWVNAQILRLPKTWETSLTSYSMEIGHEKEEALFHHRPNTGMQLTQQDAELLCEFYYESRASSGRLGIIYPKNHGMLLQFFNGLSIEDFLYILDVFHALDPQLYESFKRILQFTGSRQDLDYYWNWVRSFSSLPLYQGKLKDSHVSILENHQQAVPCGAPFNKVKSLVVSLKQSLSHKAKPVLSEPRSSRAGDAPGKEIQLSPSDYSLLAKFQNPDWYRPPLCVSGQFPVVKSEVMCLVNSLSKKDFERILNLFYIIDPNSYESFKKIITNQDSIDDHMLYDQALREFPTRP